MKSQIKKISMIILASTVCFMSCNKSIDLQAEGASQQSETPTMDDSDFDHTTELEYPSTLIATIQKDGHEIEFSTTGPPESQGIFMVESLYGIALENQEFITGLSEESTPFDIFLAMTDDEIDVPKSIAVSAKDNQLERSGRHVQETNRILNLLDENYTEPEEAKAELRNCNVPSLSCYPSYSWNIASCDYSAKTYPSSKYTYKNGWKKVRKVYARLSHNCGSVTMHFYFWLSGANYWARLRSISIPANSGAHTAFTHWVPDLVSQKVTFIPRTSHGSTAHYRTSTQFVK